MDCPSATGRVRSKVFGHCIANVKCDAFASNAPLPASAFSTCTMLPYATAPATLLDRRVSDKRCTVPSSTAA